MIIKIDKMTNGKEKVRKKMDVVLLCAPLCSDEQIVWELRQIVVLEVQDLEL